MSYDSECYCADNDGLQCVFCEMWTDGRLRALAANLAIGAALCRAERFGYQRGVHDAWSFTGDDKIEAWRSGCQRPAPGTGSGESR